MVDGQPEPETRALGAVEGRSAPTAAVLRGKVRLQDLNVGGQPVLVRADLNVPVEDGEVTDATRIEGTLPTLRHLLRGGARVVLMSHRGRPGGRRRPELSMAPVAVALSRRLQASVVAVEECIGDGVGRAIERLSDGDVLLLENLRFHPGETANDNEFAAALAAHAPIYVNDAFGASHRAHASIAGVPERCEVAAVGDLLYREVTTLSRVLVQPTAPFVLVLGGAKVTDKVGLVGNLLPLVDRIVIGGAMANAFLVAEGRDLGGSYAPEESISGAAEIVERARDSGVELVLPHDFVVASSRDRGDEARITEYVGAEEMALDIGPKSRERFGAALVGARTVVWNGPMGVFETEAFAGGTRTVAAAIADLGSEAFTVLGGGDTAAAASMTGITHQVSHISTGGGAVLELLGGAILPGVSVLSDRG